MERCRRNKIQKHISPEEEYLQGYDGDTITRLDQRHKGFQSDKHELYRIFLKINVAKHMRKVELKYVFMIIIKNRRYKKIDYIK